MFGDAVSRPPFASSLVFRFVHRCGRSIFEAFRIRMAASRYATACRHFAPFASEKEANGFATPSAPRLNNWGLTLANRSFAFTPASGEAKGENNGAHGNQELFHESSPLGNIIKSIVIFRFRASAEKSHHLRMHSVQKQKFVCQGRRRLRRRPSPEQCRRE